MHGCGLQKEYAKGNLSDLQFLHKIASVSVSHDRNLFPVFIFDIYLYSETQYISEEQQSSGDEISGYRNSNLASCPSVVLQKRKGKSKSRTKKQSEKCVECSKGFQFWRDPPLQIRCLTCRRWIHFRCIGYGYDEDSFNCQVYSPVSEPPASVSQPPPQVLVSEPPPASVSQSPLPAPATVQQVQCSLEERSDISPEQDTQPLSGEHWFKI